ncbi:response regulator [Rhodoferax sp. OV413]|uniref:response regulator n=1 Tax=Rhodoferax sp. OV413 TaxID=1855285 RepID=UPI0025F6B661|nr:response regulator [Rhodoferax sp. OV413]
MSTEPMQLAKPLRFLVVDDSRAIQAIVKRGIMRCGYAPIEIETALDGEQAIDIVPTFKPDLIITDWHMPRVSGLEMVQALRQMGHGHVRVGFVTTERTPALLEEAMSNGALFILHKPFEDAELVSVVSNAVKDLVTQSGGAIATADPAPLPPEDETAKKTDDPIPYTTLQLLLVDRLGNLPFRLIPNERMTMDKLTTNNFLGLYAAKDSKGVYAIAVMDSNAVCMVGGGAARMSPQDVRAVMGTGTIDGLMMDKAHEFLRAAAAGLTDSAPVEGMNITLAKTSVVKNTFAKLSEVLAKPGQRSDFRLSIPGYGEGRMAFFVMTV